MIPESELDTGFWGQFLNIDEDQWLQDILAMDDPLARLF